MSGNKRISDLTLLTVADLADADLFVVVDVSAPVEERTKKTTLADLSAALVGGGGVGTGDFVGPSSSTTNALLRFASGTGKVGKNSGVLLDDNQNFTGVHSVGFFDSANNQTITLTAGDNTIVLSGSASINLGASGSITTGSWQGQAVGPTKGGTGLSSYMPGQIIYASATNTLSKLTGNISTDRKFLRQQGDGANSAAPAWDTLQAGDIPLDATLTAFAALTIAANSLTVGAGADAFSQVTFGSSTFPARASSGSLSAKPITDFALTFLDDADAASVRTTIGAGTSSFDGAFSSLSGKPTTLSGYGITDAQGLDAALTALAAGSDYVQFTGPTSTVKVFTLPDSSQALLYSGGPLGTPASGVGTNLTGTAAGLTAGTVTTNANLTGPITSVGNATSVASQTGTGNTFAMSASPTFSGTLTLATGHVTGNLTVDGDLTVSGTTTTVNTDTLTVKDPLIKLASGNASDASDVGFYGLYTSSGAKYTGLFRDASDGKYKLFTALQSEPTTTVDTAGTGYSVATLVASLEGGVTGDVVGNLTGNVTGNVSGSSGSTTGNAATATILATTHTIGGSNFNGSADVTSFPSPGAIGGTTPAAGTFTALTGTSGSITGLTTLAIRDTSAAFDVTLAAVSSTTLTAGRTLTLDLTNAARTVKLTGSPTLADWFDQSVKTGASPTFVTVTAALSGNATTATTLATSRNLWGQGFTGAADVTGSLTSVGDITGGASSMTITAGTGASRTLTFKTTTSGNTATTALTLNADQTATFAAAVSIGTGNAFTCGTVELGAASDTTLSRVSAGVIAVEGVNILTTATGQPLDTQLTSLAALSYSGNSLKVVRVNAGETDFELATLASVSAANPTASVGLSAVNGSSATFLRSDGAPALDQSIAPTWTAPHTFTPAARSSGSAAYLTVNAPADTGLTASTEAIGVNFVGAIRQHATGALTTQREVVFGAPTYSAVGATTITKAATVAIAAAPTAGTNVTLTNKYAFWVQAGKSEFDDQVALSLSNTGFALDITNSDGTFGSGLKISAGANSSSGPALRVTKFDSTSTIFFTVTGTGDTIVSPAQLSTSATNGFLWIPQCSGTPTGTPSSGLGGSAIPMVYDVSGNILYLYTGGAWKKATASLVTGAVTWQ